MPITCEDVEDCELLKEVCVDRKFVLVHSDQSTASEFSYPRDYEFTSCFLRR